MYFLRAASKNNMRSMKLVNCVLELALVYLMLAGAARSTPADEVRIAAASDLTKVFSEIGSIFEKRTGIHAAFTFGASGTLTRQIENGAPYDLFAAANTGYIDQLCREAH